MQPSAKVIADSINENGVRLTTFEVTFHRFVLAEFNTHCVLSRNSASSRAIPVRKTLAKIWRDPALPLSWPAEQKGMQGGDELNDEQVTLAKRHWLLSRDYAVDKAQELVNLGVHKSVANRLLEPYASHTAVVSATAWENFFEQRCSPLAQPEIRAVAELMQDAREASEPDKAEEGSWHLPYIDDATVDEVSDRVRRAGKFDEGAYWAMLAQISAARCARVSYLTQDGKRDIEQDLELYTRLTTARPAHWSPLEHVATPWSANIQAFRPGSVDSLDFAGLDGHLLTPPTHHLPRIGKLLQWRTLRTTVEAAQGAITFK